MPPDKTGSPALPYFVLLRPARQLVALLNPLWTWAAPTFTPLFVSPPTNARPPAMLLTPTAVMAAWYVHALPRRAASAFQYWHSACVFLTAPSALHCVTVNEAL